MSDFLVMGSVGIPEITILGACVVNMDYTVRSTTLWHSTDYQVGCPYWRNELSDRLTSQNSYTCTPKKQQQMHLIH